MKKTFLLGLVLFAGSALWATDTITPLDVKLGQWESTLTTESNGLPPIPPEVLDRLSPEQRAKMEERMKAYACAGAQNHHSKKLFEKRGSGESAVVR